MAESPRPHPGLAAIDRALQLGDFDEVRRLLRRLDVEGVELLEAQLGAGTVQKLRRLSRGQRARKRGRVVVLHGIMGSNLNVVDASGDVDRVWVNYWRLVWGRFRDFEMDLQGNSTKGVRVEVDGQHKSYLALTLGLSRNWHVLPFAYDWRRDIGESAAKLAAAIRDWAGDEPVHLVAHSMGGLVSRRFMRDFTTQWRSLLDPTGNRAGGQLVMLGTPNRGSYDIPLVFSGQDALIQKLAKWEFGRDSLANILRVIGKFPGAYQMLPSPLADVADDHVQLFRKRSWGTLPLHQALLDRAAQFHTDLDRVQDPGRLTYIAGYGEETPYRVHIARPGQLEVFKTLEGDGRVPHSLGLLDGVDTYWVREVHGDLPGNESVIRAVDELLATGRTNALMSSGPPRRRGADQLELERWHVDATAGEASIRELLAAGKRRSEAAPSPQLLRQAARADQLLVEDYLGKVRDLDSIGPDPDRTPRTARPKLRVRVLWGDLRECHSDVVCVGHYRGVLPQYAERALDQVISPKPPRDANTPPKGLLHSLTERGVLIGELGEVQFYPWREHPERLGAVVGMGYPGTFTEPSLRLLARNLTWAIAGLPRTRSAATVLIGTGGGGLSIFESLRGMFEGVLDALGEGLPDSALQELCIVEYYYDKAQRVHAALTELAAHLGKRIELDLAGSFETGKGGWVSGSHGRTLALAAQASASDPAGDDLALVDGILEWIPVDPPALRAGARQALQHLAADYAERSVEELANDFAVERCVRGTPTTPTRVAFIRNNREIRSSAITETAVVSERVERVDPALIRQLIESATDPDPSDLRDLARMVHRLLVPADIGEKFKQGAPLILELDRFTAGVHWELMTPDCDGPTPQHLGLLQPVSRQLRTEYSPPPAPSRIATRGKPRALVIGDPDGSLEGARWEAERVEELLRERYEVTSLLGPEPATGGGSLRGTGASRFKVLHYLNKYEFEVLHYSGHGDFDPEDPSQVGWVFEDGLLTANELRTVPRVPRLVVANACLSGLVSEVTPQATEVHALHRDYALLPSLADEFFRRGVHNYVGTAWEVDDEGAVLFAETLYDQLLAGHPIGHAMWQARCVLHEDFVHSALWLAYQHYGHPDFTL